MTRADYTLAVRACLACCVHGLLLRLAAHRGHCVSRCCRRQVAYVHVAAGLGSSRRPCVATLFLFLFVCFCMVNGTHARSRVFTFCVACTCPGGFPFVGSGVRPFGFRCVLLGDFPLVGSGVRPLFCQVHACRCLVCVAQGRLSHVRRLP